MNLLVLVYTRTVAVLLSARALGWARFDVSSVCRLLCTLGVLDTFLARLQYCSCVRGYN